jgi:hypothetical protein
MRYAIPSRRGRTPMKADDFSSSAPASMFNGSGEAARVSGPAADAINALRLLE